MLDNQQQREALLYERICTTLAVEILDGDWPEKTALTLEEIQHRFGISRTVAREVAKLLEAVNAVTVRRRVGLVPNPVQQWDALNTQVIQWKLASTHRKQQLLDLTELRLAIEPAAAASAAQVAPAQVRALMPVLAAQLRRTGEAGELESSTCSTSSSTPPCCATLGTNCSLLSPTWWPPFCAAAWNCTCTRSVQNQKR